MFTYICSETTQTIKNILDLQGHVSNNALQSGGSPHKTVFVPYILGCLVNFIFSCFMFLVNAFGFSLYCVPEQVDKKFHVVPVVLDMQLQSYRCMYVMYLWRKLQKIVKQSYAPVQCTTIPRTIN